MTNVNEGTVTGLAATLSLNGVEPGRLLTPGKVEGICIGAVRRMAQGIPFVSVDDDGYGVTATVHVGNPVFRLLYEHVGAYPLDDGYDPEPVSADCPDPDGGWFDSDMGDEYPAGVLADALNAATSSSSARFSVRLRSVADWIIDGESEGYALGIHEAFRFIRDEVPFDFAE